jgi:hypothetical protein
MAEEATAKTSLSPCYHWNSRKGPNLSGLDPESGALVRLFHPRQDRWMSTSSATESSLSGRSAVGGATVGLLKMNAADRLSFAQGSFYEERTRKITTRFPDFPYGVVLLM